MTKIKSHFLLSRRCLDTNTYIHILLYSGNYDCLDDTLSADPISVKLKDEKGRTLYKSVPGESEAIFELHVKRGGRFSLCLHHKGDAEELDRTVGFALRVRPQARALEDAVQGPDGEKALELIEWAEDLTEVRLGSMCFHSEILHANILASRSRNGRRCWIITIIFVRGKQRKRNCPIRSFRE